MDGGCEVELRAMAVESVAIKYIYFSQVLLCHDHAAGIHLAADWMTS